MRRSSMIPSYEPISFRGSGAFGYVIEAYDKINDMRVAIKRTHKVGNKLSREYQILAALKGCPQTVEMLNTFYSVNDEGNIVQNIVFEYVSNSLQQEIDKLEKSNTHFSIEQLQKITQQLLLGLEFAHSKSIVHRDLKPENVLFTSDGRVKICDWGSSKFITKGDKSTPYMVSRYYRAPELVLGCFDYGSSIDIFATGCILFELASFTPLFPGKEEGLQLIEHMCFLGMPSRSYLERYPCGKVFYDEVVSRISTVNTADIFEVLNKKKVYPSEMLRDLTDLIMKMIKWEPELRINATEALKHVFLTKTYKSRE